MLSLVLSEMSPLVTTVRPPSRKTELLEESVPSEIVLVVLVVGLEQENFLTLYEVGGSGDLVLSIN